MDHIGLACCFLTMICWGISPVFLRKSLETFDNTEINAIRSVGTFAGSALVCIIAAPHLIIWPYGFKALSAVFAVMLLGNAIGDLCYMVAIDNIGVGRGLSTSNSYPIFISVISVLWLGETPSLRLWAGTAVIIIGLAFLNCAKADVAPEPGAKVRSSSRGFAMAIIAAVLWAASLSIQKWALQKYSIEASGFVFWRGLMLLAAAWAVWLIRKKGGERKFIFNAGYGKWLLPALAGASSLAVGGALFAYALRTIPVSVASPISASNPVIGAVIAKFVFDERLSPLQWLGVLMVIIGGIEVTS